MAQVFLTLSREANLHSFFQYDPDGEGSWGGSAYGKPTGWAPAGWYKSRLGPAEGAHEGSVN